MTRSERIRSTFTALSAEGPVSEDDLITRLVQEAGAAEAAAVLRLGWQEAIRSALDDDLDPIGEEVFSPSPDGVRSFWRLISGGSRRGGAA